MPNRGSSKLAAGVTASVAEQERVAAKKDRPRGVTPPQDEVVGAA